MVLKGVLRCFSSFFTCWPAFGRRLRAVLCCRDTARSIRRPLTNGRSFTVTFSNAYPRYTDNSHKSTKLSLTTAIRQILPHRPCANSFVLAGVVARAVVCFFSLSYGVTPTSSFPKTGAQPERTRVRPGQKRPTESLMHSENEMNTPHTVEK